MKWVFLIFCRPAGAATLESHYLHALANARNSQEVEKHQEAYETLKIAQLACRIQLREEQIPFCCYEAEQLARRAGWREDPAAAARRLAQLDQLCGRAAAQLKVSATLPEVVSKTCKQKIRAAQRIRAYREEETPSWSEY